MDGRYQPTAPKGNRALAASGLHAFSHSLGTSYLEVDLIGHRKGYWSSYVCLTQNCLGSEPTRKKLPTRVSHHTSSKLPLRQPWLHLLVPLGYEPSVVLSILHQISFPSSSQKGNHGWVGRHHKTQLHKLS